MAATKDFIFRLIGESRGIDEMNRKSKGLSINMGQLAARAALVIPVWAVLRTTMLALPQVIGAATKAFLEFDKAMARVSTVSRDSAKAVGILKKEIVNFTAASTASFNDTASAVYALGSAGLSAAEQLAGMEAVMNTAIGLGGNVEQTAKLMAGAYNVFGDSLKDVTTLSEKFQKIGDTIAYTYSTQQVELSELANALGYVASAGSQINIEFDELVTTIGVLNTGLLKSSKAGTSLVNAFIKIAKNTGKLKDIGINVDPSKPLDFLDVMKQLNERLGEAKLSTKNLNILYKTFGIRGGRAIGLLLTNFTAFEKAIKKAKTDSEGFALVMRKIQEDTIPGMGAKIKNTFQAIWMDTLSDFESPFKSMLKQIGKALDDFRANQKVKGLLGETTLPQQIGKVGAAGGAGLGALLLGSRLGGSGQIGRTANFPGFLSSQAVAKRAFSLRLQAGKVGTVGGRGGIAGAALSDKDTALRQVLLSSQARGRGATPKDFVTSAQGELIKETGKQVGGFGNTMRALGGTLLTTIKVATLAYAGIKLLQAGLNAFAPDNPSVQAFNDAIGSIEEGVLTAAVVLIEFFDDLFLHVSVLAEQFKAVYEKAAPKKVRDEIADIAGGPIGILEMLLDPSKIGSKIGGHYSEIITEHLFGAVYDSDAKKKAKEAGKALVEEILTPFEQRKLARDEARAAKVADRNKLRDLVKGTSKGVNEFQLANDQVFGGRKLLEDVEDSVKRLRAEESAKTLGISGFLTTLNQLDTEMVKNLGNEEETNKIADKLIQTYGGLHKALEETKKEFTDQTGITVFVEEFKKKFKLFSAAFAENLSPEAAKKLREDMIAFSSVRGTNRTGAESAPPIGLEDASASSLSRDLDALYAKQDLDIAKSLGMSEAVALQIELNAEVEKFNQGHAKQIEVSDLLLKNKEALLQDLGSEKEEVAAILSLQKKALDIHTKQLEEIAEKGKEIRTVFKGAFNDLLTGDLGFEGFGARIASGFNDALASQFSTVLTDVMSAFTGLDAGFGGMFQGLANVIQGPMEKMKKSHLEGILQGLPHIVNAHIDGMAKGASGASKTYTQGGTGVGGLVGVAAQGIMGAFSGVSNWMNTPVGNVQAVPGGVQSSIKPGSMGAPLNAQGQQIGGSAMTGGKMVGGGLNVAMSAYSGYHEAGGGGWGALRGGLAGVGAALMMIPSGITQIIGAAMIVGSMFIRGQKDPGQPDNTKKVEEFGVTSRIDVSNKELSMVNRNLVALQDTMTYILTDSAYFSEARNLGDQFALHSSRGL